MTKVVTARADGPANVVAKTLIEQARRGLDGASPALVLVFASTSQPLAELMPEFVAAWPESTVLGASTAGEFTEAGDGKGSTSLLALAGDFVVHGGMGRSLEDNLERAVHAAVDGLPVEVPGFYHRTALLLLDPLAGNGEEASLITASLLGDHVRLAGGAAGDDLAMTRTYVALGDQIASDAIVVATVFSKRPLGVGVCHGHLPYSEPVTVTKAEGGRVNEIDGRPAWDVWRERTRTIAAARGVDPNALRDDEIGAFLLTYEAGLAVGDDYKIRAPLSKESDGSLNFACGIPEGASIQVMESAPDRQIASAREAARRAAAQMHGARVAGAVVFDCICRNLILGDQFQLAVRGISSELGDVPVAGFETYGEIAMDAGDMSGFHNTTTVVLAFPD